MDTKNVNYGLLTRLPVKVVAKADRLNPVIEVETPHKGTVFVELKVIENGLFRKATELDKKTDYVAEELYKLEREAKEYLLSKWLEDLIK